ncbi:MAG: hypothetical protein RMK60_11915, partial [Burkholderiales bacterium]|nr:hypothetical protein [Burkholderiales bacterium]
RYHFGAHHPFGPARYPAFMQALESTGLAGRVSVCPSVEAKADDLLLFHTPEHVAFVRQRSTAGGGYLDFGDTPAVPGIFQAAARVAGTTLAAVDAVLAGRCRRAFVPIAGLHHARRDAAAGFCVFNDIGIAIEHLRRRHGIERILYVDIDAHHGDGVYYAYEDDPAVYIVDVHEDGRWLYPGTGARAESGRGAAVGSKLNLPLPPGADAAAFFQAWAEAERFLAGINPQFVLLQCGADSLAGDPITHLRLTAAVHGEVARRLVRLADEHCDGRLLALGGGGYEPRNIAAAWCAVVGALLGE